jgi:hypothetical protein
MVAVPEEKLFIKKFTLTFAAPVGNVNLLPGKVPVHRRYAALIPGGALCAT